jgi:segregation and condensation protein A
MNPVFNSYTVKTSTFEGPLDLLLSLIESRKLFVNEVSLATVTNDYIEYVKSLENGALSDVANFIVIAATLVLIKSRSLLPNIDLTIDEKEKIVDLGNRLRIYQMVKDIGVELSQTYGKKILFHSPERSIETPLFVPSPLLNIDNLSNTLKELLVRIPKPEPLPEVTMRKVVSIEHMITSLTERIAKSIKFSFNEFSSVDSPEEYREKKVYVIVTFLAMLELVRQGIVDVLQEGQFSDIEINKLTNDQSQMFASEN